MELFPNAQFVKLYVLRINGVRELYIPIKELIPITPYDYWCASWQVWFKQHNCIDLDMIYANYNSKEMYVFDKAGEWKDEGLNHSSLSMDKTFNETNWYDEFSPNNF